MSDAGQTCIVVGAVSAAEVDQKRAISKLLKFSTQGKFSRENSRARAGLIIVDCSPRLAGSRVGFQAYCTEKKEHETTITRLLDLVNTAHTYYTNTAVVLLLL